MTLVERDAKIAELQKKWQTEVRRSLNYNQCKEINNKYRKLIEDLIREQLD